MYMYMSRCDCTCMYVCLFVCVWSDVWTGCTVEDHDNDKENRAKRTANANLGEVTVLQWFN